MIGSNGLIKLKRKKIIVSILILFLISTSLFAIKNYTDEKHTTKLELENAIFVIDALDILGSNDNKIEIEFRLNVSNFEPKKQSNLIEVLDLEIRLFNQSIYLTKISFSLINIHLNNSQIIRSNIIIETNNPTNDLDGFLSNIILGKNFELDFIGLLQFKTAKFVEDNIEFSNTILFQLDKREFKVGVNILDMKNEKDVNATVTVEITNPFTTDFIILGTALVYLDHYLVGKILIEKPIIIQNGYQIFLLPIILNDQPGNMFSDFLNNYNNNIIIITNFLTEFGTIKMEISPIFIIEINENIIDISVSNLREFSIDQNIGTFQAILDFNVVSSVPIKLNLTTIYLNITTLAGNYVGQVMWKTFNPVILEPGVNTTVSDVALSFKNISISLFLELIIDQAISIPLGITTIQFYNQHYEYSFTIDNLQI